MPVHDFGFKDSTLSAKVLNVYDACTFKVQFKLSSKIELVCKCRLLDMDCPRMRPNPHSPVYAEEREAAKCARLYFMRLLRQLSEDGDYFPIECHGHVGGQVLVTVPWDEDCGSVSEVMVRAGHLRPMSQHQRPPWSFPEPDPTLDIGDEDEKEDDGHKDEADT